MAADAPSARPCRRRGSARADQPAGAPGAPQVRRYMPFLEGSRQCVGISLARMTTAATVAALLSRFTFRLADDVRAPCLHCS